VQEKVTDKIGDVVKDDIWGSIQKFLDLGWTFGKDPNEIEIKVQHVLIVILAFFIASFLLKWIRLFFTRKMETNDKQKFISVFKFIKYITYIIVVFASLSFAGIDVTPILAASAALLLGLGLALQELFQDVIAGIFIIIDKSLLVGDIIEVDGKVGRVIDIKLRTTRTITRDDKIVIIPNHKFITDTIYNYTQNHRTTREFVKVGVAYGSDTHKVRDLLLSSVEKQAGVLKSPKPFVLFEDFGDSALVFSIYFYIADSFVDPRIKSEIRFKIDALFREHNISIPFPQRDVHIFNNQTKSKDGTNLADD